MSNETLQTSGLLVETANDRFKKSFSTYFWASMIGAVVVHFAVFAFFPQMYADDVATISTELEAINIPPEVELPPPPEQIQRPARPVISDAVLNDDITIAETTFEALPDVAAPPPPIRVESTVATGPQFTPFDVAPSLSNRNEMSQALMREYPPVLKDAGISGDVVLHFHISETGAVLETVLAESSGHQSMDDAAQEVASIMRFTPAQNLDKTVAVWVELTIKFTSS
jgi:TonB family protein